jgi:hypothetical protein
LIASDLINGGLEFGGSIFLWVNVRALRRAKKVVGVFWGAPAYFTLWGLWNLFYFPSLGQWFSLCGAMSIAAANITWLVLALYYEKRNAKKPGM